jgi:two-component system response regulator ChvI
MALEKEGFIVQTYIDGENALVGLTRSPPDLAVVDIKMPRMDGEELLKRLRKKNIFTCNFFNFKR